MNLKIIKEGLFFSLNVISTIIFVNFIPKIDAPQILANYSIASGILSIIVVYTMTIKLLLDKIKSIIFIIIALSILHSIYVGNAYAITLYVCVYVLVDYLATQAYVEKKNNVRMISFFANGIIPIFGIEAMIAIRIVLGLIFIFFFLKSDKKVKQLKIKNVNTVILKSNIIYFGTLYLLTIYSSIGLQQIYTVFQIGLSYALKLYDFQLRNIDVITKSKVVIFAQVLGMLPWTFFFIVDANYVIHIMYAFAYISLIRLESFL